MSFVGFLANYADEALGIAKALTGLLDGVAINGQAANDINATIARLEKAHAELTKYVAANPAATAAPVIKIQKADIDKAVKAELAKVLPGLIDAAVKKNMQNK